MDRDEALASLDAVRNADRRMAGRMRWPFYRHAMFGVSEALIVMGIGIPGSTGIAFIAAGLALLVVQFYGDKRRDGMFVSGYKGTNTRRLTLSLVLLLMMAVGASLILRWDHGTNPLVVGLGALVAIVCTFASLWWERLYRAELLGGGLR
ncbi:hypothetical protein [Alteriqipengyuania sp. 357]